MREGICHQIKLPINTSLLLLAPSIKACGNTTNKRWESGRTTGQNRDSCSFKLHRKIWRLSVSVKDRQMCQNSIPSDLKIAFCWIQEQSLKAGSRKMAKGGASAKVQGGVLARVALLSLTWLDTMANLLRLPPLHLFTHSFWVPILVAEGPYLVSISWKRVTQKSLKV